MFVGLATLLTSPAFAQAPASVYGTGNIIFPGNPSAAAAAGAYGTGISPDAAGAFAYEPSRAGKAEEAFNCACNVSNRLILLAVRI
jgi:hypothetical protein